MQYTFDMGPVLAAWPALLNGAIQTLKISSISMVLGLALGIVFMLLRMSSVRVISLTAFGYIELIRNTPFLVQLFFIFFGMPSLGVTLSAEQAAILAMTLNCAAYAAEIVRGGVESIKAGQIEAGKALGLHTIDIYRFIIFRPAIRAVYPALCSQFILMMLNSSLVASISAEELTYVGQMIDSETFRSFEIYFVLGVIYLALSQFFSIVLQIIGRTYFSYPSK
ncbi:amino acid ABC transporter permease [Brucella intermedia]|uniref:Amino acid ABC transporter permease n=1 Tax=Brucella intermedia TaxID=94625 RepID=A0A7V6PET2_9HYPH|nr:amino acid ABC transporter permease [Brucella intermedia]PJR93162.1 ABC transporter permease [Ochrobactrum sp. 721/2009]PJT15299.1 ABC transporter permease [Ochrobactrum sp. 720/2009]PJT23254.1 ABC transporter permease [Ochrobactrum sp. 715/2009]PJT29077.1 ABC transporter permease [Ochrobactrum sp. 695/2009]PJT32583.1 ABC transporter permease [Ochrobactrum sp. 689/2009]